MMNSFRECNVPDSYDQGQASAYDLRQVFATSDGTANATLRQGGFLQGA
jgi:hypothetical protein